VTWDHITQLEPRAAMVDADTRLQVWRDALYAQYLHRQTAEAETLQRNEHIRIPADLEFSGLPGLSNELVAKLQRRRPASLAEAERIEGMTPAALLLILAHCRKSVHAKAAAL
jgi:tRNA uridine 5-carboxymethylaminomethyl modification enzyme